MTKHLFIGLARHGAQKGVLVPSRYGNDGDWQSTIDHAFERVSRTSRYQSTRDASSETRRPIPQTIVDTCLECCVSGLSSLYGTRANVEGVFAFVILAHIVGFPKTVSLLLPFLSSNQQLAPAIVTLLLIEVRLAHRSRPRPPVVSQFFFVGTSLWNV
jgi:hypothetical protein